MSHSIRVLVLNFLETFRWGFSVFSTKSRAVWQSCGGVDSFMIFHDHKPPNWFLTQLASLDLPLCLNSNVLIFCCCLKCSWTEKNTLAPSPVSESRSLPILFLLGFENVKWKDPNLRKLLERRQAVWTRTDSDRPTQQKPSPRCFVNQFNWIYGGAVDLNLFICDWGTVVSSPDKALWDVYAFRVLTHCEFVKPNKINEANYISIKIN